MHSLLLPKEEYPIFHCYLYLYLEQLFIHQLLELHLLLFSQILLPNLGKILHSHLGMGKDPARDSDGDLSQISTNYAPLRHVLR